MRLSATPCLRQCQHCSVCRQEWDSTAADSTSVQAALFGAKRFAVCPCCGQEADPKDPRYTRRARKWLYDGKTMSARRASADDHDPTSKERTSDP